VEGGLDCEDAELLRQARLLGRALAQSDVLRALSYSVVEDGRVTSTGWQGSPPPKAARDVIVRRYLSREILQDLKTFRPVPYW
jgi:hypothetical protein